MGVVCKDKFCELCEGDGDGLFKEMFQCRVWGCWYIRRRHDDIRCEEVGRDQTMSRKWFVS